MVRCEGDGWHRVGHYHVLVEDRVITYCTKPDSNGHQVPAWVYVNSRMPASRQYYWIRAAKVTLAALRAGMRRGTMTIM